MLNVLQNIYSPYTKRVGKLQFIKQLRNTPLGVK